MYYQLMTGEHSQRVDVECSEALVSVKMCFVRSLLAKTFCCEFLIAVSLEVVGRV